MGDSVATDTTTTTLKLTKKQRKALQFRGKLEKPEKDQTTPTKSKKKKTKQKEEEKPPKKKFEKQVNSAGNAVRFIAFVGNLPFKATAEEVQEFFKAANPSSVRLMTDKQTGKSRGFAFVDFATSADLKHALKFHHMPLGTKKINVELTAGGGGNSEARKEKIKRRREELEKERTTKRQRTDTATTKEQKDEVADGQEPVDKDDGGQGIDDYGYDDGSSATKTKKPNRRKRGRGSRK